MDRGAGDVVRNVAVTGVGSNRPILLRPFAVTGLSGCLAFLVLLAATILVQLRDGAHSLDFSDDDAAHYVTGLLFHDYLLSGLRVGPIAYLRDYHSHYPIVGIGHWGPFYYLVEAAWMLVASPSRNAFLTLSATVTATTATLLFHLVTTRIGLLQGVLAALMLIGGPIVADATVALMLDMPVACLSLVAMLAYTAYLDTGRARWSVLFGLAAAAGLLIQGNALALALLPPLAVLLGRRFDLLRMRSFWLPAGIVGVLALPWIAYTYPLVAPGFRHPWGWPFTSIAVPANLSYFALGMGLPAAILAAAGCLWVIGRSRAMAADVTAVSLVLAYLIFNCAVPSEVQERYIAPALPAALYLAWRMLDRIMVVLGARLRDLTVAAHVFAGVVITLVAVLSTKVVTPRPRSGLIEAARFIGAQEKATNPSVLVALDGNAETGMVAELALNDRHRPSLFAVRGSRLLGGGGYNNRDYQPRFTSSAGITAEIDRFAIQFVVHQPPRQPGAGWLHVDQVAEAALREPDRWRPVFRSGPAGREVVVYRLRGNDTRELARAELLVLSAPRSLGN